MEQENEGTYSTASYIDCSGRHVSIIGYLEHKPTNIRISVYNKIGFIQRFFLKHILGLEFIKISNEWKQTYL